MAFLETKRQNHSSTIQQSVVIAPFGKVRRHLALGKILIGKYRHCVYPANMISQLAITY